MGSSSVCVVDLVTEEDKTVVTAERRILKQTSQLWQTAGGC